MPYDEPDLPVDVYPGPKSPLRSFPRDWASAFKPNNPNAWNTPRVFQSTTSEAGGSGNAAGPSTGSTKQEESPDPGALELHKIRREIKMMAKSDPATILQRLREPCGDVSDGSEYKEFEMVKKRWMLSALYSLDGVVKMDAMPSEPAEKNTRRVLALFESHCKHSYQRGKQDKHRRTALILTSRLFSYYLIFGGSSHQGPGLPLIAVTAVARSVPQRTPFGCSGSDIDSSSLGASLLDGILLVSAECRSHERHP